MLLTSNDSSIQNERRVALVIAHEMAHLVRTVPALWSENKYPHMCKHPSGSLNTVKTALPIGLTPKQWYKNADWGDWGGSREER